MPKRYKTHRVRHALTQGCIVLVDFSFLRKSFTNACGSVGSGPVRAGVHRGSNEAVTLPRRTECLERALASGCRLTCRLCPCAPTHGSPWRSESLAGQALLVWLVSLGVISNHICKSDLLFFPKIRILKKCASELLPCL